MRLSALLERLSLDLSDPGAVTWAREQLAWWLDEAIRLAIALRPGWFAADRVLELRSGPERFPVCPCAVLTRGGVLGQSTPDGHVIKALRPRGDDPGLRWFPEGCAPRRSRPFLLDEYSVSPDGRGVRVFPEIPPGETVWLAVRCEAVPDLQDGDAEIPDEALPALIQWVLHRAKGMDAENNPAVMYAARDHKETFFLLLTGSRPPRGGRGRKNADGKTKDPAAGSD